MRSLDYPGLARHLHPSRCRRTGLVSLVSIAALTCWVHPVANVQSALAEPPRITSRAVLPQASVGQDYSFQFTSTRNSKSLSWKLLPIGHTDWDGWKLEPGGRLTGKIVKGAPCDPNGTCGEGWVCGSGKHCEGVMTFNLILSDESGRFDQRMFDLVVTDPVDALEVGSFDTLIPAAVGQAYEAPIYARGGTAPFTWRKTKGTLPAGITFDSGGVLSGMPKAAGSFSWTAEVTDSTGKKATKSISLRVDDLSKPIAFAPNPKKVLLPVTPRIGLNVRDETTHHWDDIKLTNQYIENPGFEPSAPYRKMYLAWAGTANTIEEHDLAQYLESEELNTGYWNGGHYWILSGPAKGREGTIAKYERVQDKSIKSGYRAVWTLADSDPKRVVENKPDPGDLDKNIFMVEAPPRNASDPSKFKGTVPPGWTPLSDEGATFSVEKAKPAGGVQSAKIVSTNNVPVGLAAVISYTNPWRRLRKDTTYRFSVDVRQSGLSDGKVWIQMTPPFYLVEHFYLQGFRVPNDGKFHRITGEVPGNDRGDIGFQILIQTKGTVWIDNALFYESRSTKTLANSARQEPVPAKAFEPLPFVLDDLRALRVGCLRFWYHDYFLPLKNALTASSESAPGPNHNLYANLKLAETLGSNAWIIAAKEWLPSEFAQLVEYLSSTDTTKGLGKLRAEQGHPAPWTQTIGRIYIEYVDEAWNFPSWAYPFDPWHPTKYSSFAKERFNAVRASKYYSPKLTLVASGQLADDYWVNDPIDKLTYPSHDAMDAAPYMDSFTVMATPMHELAATVLEEDVGHTRTLMGTAKIWASRKEKTKMLVYEGGPASVGAFPSVADEIRKNSMILASLSLDSIADLFAHGIGEYNVFIYQNNFGWQVMTGASSRFRLPIWYAIQMFNATAGDGTQVETKGVGAIPTLKGIGYDTKDYHRIDGEVVPAISARSYVKKDRKSFVLINRNPQVEYPVILQTQDNDVSYRVTTLAASRPERGTLEGLGLLEPELSQRDLSKIFEAVQPKTGSVKSVQGNVKIALPPTSIVTVQSGAD